MTADLHSRFPSFAWGPPPTGWERARSRTVLRPLPRMLLSAASAPELGEPECRSPKMARLEAALLVASSALTTRRLAQVATLADRTEARQLIEQLNAVYDRSGTPFRIERVATGYLMLTRPEYARWLDKLHQRQTALKLSSPMMETLAIIAYRQPITRADVEAVRGVQSTEILKQLMERNLVRIAGEEDSLGRPYLYGTTKQFLEQYGLRSLDQLPGRDQLCPPRDAAAGDDLEGVDSDEDMPAAEAA